MTNSSFLENGVHFKLLSRLKPAGIRSGLFFDRDGVIVTEVGYLHRIDEIEFLPNVVEIIRTANSHKVPTIIISNQSGIARGIYGWDDYKLVEEEIVNQLANDGAMIDACIACGTHPKYTSGWTSNDAYWRKPGPGMLRLAAEHIGIELSSSWLIGDKFTDVLAAKTANLAGCVHLDTGYGLEDRSAALLEAGPDFEVFPASDLAEAKRHLIHKGLFR